jgi:hypothetical protein
MTQVTLSLFSVQKALVLVFLEELKYDSIMWLTMTTTQTR